MRPLPAALVLALASGALLAGCLQEGSESVTPSNSDDAGAGEASDRAVPPAARDRAGPVTGGAADLVDAGRRPADGAGAAEGAAAAPEGPGGPPPRGADAAAGGSTDEEAVREGRLQATVESVSPTDGAVTLRSTGDPVQLRGTPFQLAGLLPGQQVEVTWRTYGKVRWMTGREGPGDRVFARSGVVRGTVERREVPQGRLVVTTDAGRSTLRGHPEQLGAVVPGQFVEVPFVRVDQTAWLAETPRVVAAGDASSP